MGLRKAIGSIVGDTWASAKMVAIWPWPATVIGTHGTAGELFTALDYRFFTSILQPGDFIVTRSKGFFGSNLAIPGAFKHLAVYIGQTTGTYKGDQILKPRWLGRSLRHTGLSGRVVHERTIIHAVSEGVIAQDLLTLVKHSDYAAIIRCWETSSQQIVICKAARARVGIPYNFDFTPSGPEASYCTELGAHCLMRANLDAVPETKVALGPFKRRYIPLADDFIEEYGTLGCTASAADPAFASKSHRAEMLRLTLSMTRDYRDS